MTKDGLQLGGRNDHTNLAPRAATRFSCLIDLRTIDTAYAFPTAALRPAPVVERYGAKTGAKPRTDMGAAKKRIFLTINPPRHWCMALNVEGASRFRLVGIVLALSFRPTRLEVCRPF